MSKIRGVFPLFLATTFGIVNGIWVFQPLLASKQEGTGDLAKQPPESTQQPRDSDVKTIRQIEEPASRNSISEAAQKPAQPARSWWPNVGLWSKPEDSAIKSSSESLRVEASKTRGDTKEPNT